MRREGSVREETVSRSVEVSVRSEKEVSRSDRRQSSNAGLHMQQHTCTCLGQFQETGGKL